MIDKLTASQEALLKEYRGKVFGYATSTVTDKPKAEAAALRLTKGVLVEPEIHWICRPSETEELFCSLSKSTVNSLWILLWDSLLDSLSDSLSDSPWNSLWNLLRNSLRNSLWNLLRDSLSDSLWNSLWDSGFVAYYRFPEIAGIVKYEESVSMRLRCYEELNESCFAMHLLPGHIILLEKPKRVKVDDGKLIEIEW